MTLNDILTASLAQLDRGRDAQTMEANRERLTGYANEAQADLARAMGFSRTDELEVTDGVADLSKLPRACVKVLKAEQLGHEVRFGRGSATGLITLPYSEPARVTYLCEPKPLRLPGDVSELPLYCHGLIPGYVVGRERMAGDTSTQRGANIYLSMYETAKAKLRPHSGDPESYRIKNRY